jgi:hypothetical protein
VATFLTRHLEDSKLLQGSSITLADSVFTQPIVYTVDSQSQAGYGDINGDDDDNVEDEDEELVETMEQLVTTVIDVAPSTLKVKNPTARHSTVYGINQAAITMCNQAVLKSVSDC